MLTKTIDQILPETAARLPDILTPESGVLCQSIRYSA